MTGAPVQPSLSFWDGLTDAFGPLFNTNFPVYDSSNVLVGHVNSASDLAAGNINYLPGVAPIAPSQLQVTNFWGFLQPAGAYLSGQGISPSWSDDPFQSNAPANQSPVDLLFQPASEDQYSQSIGDAVNSLNPLNNVDWTTLAIYGGAAVAGIILLKRLVR